MLSVKLKLDIFNFLMINVNIKCHENYFIDIFLLKWLLICVKVWSKQIKKKVLSYFYLLMKEDVMEKDHDLGICLDNRRQINCDDENMFTFYPGRYAKASLYKFLHIWLTRSSPIFEKSAPYTIILSVTRVVRMKKKKLIHVLCFVFFFFAMSLFFFPQLLTTNSIYIEKD